MTDDQQPAKSSNTALKVLGIGCLVLVALGIVGGILLFVFFESIARSAGSKVLETTAQAGLQQMHVPTEVAADVQDALKRELTDRIRNEELDVEQTIQVLAVVAEDPVAGAIAVEGFENRHIARSIPAEERGAAERTTDRFTRALLDDQVEQGVIEELLGIGVRQTGENQYELKEDLTVEEVQRCLELMQQAADQAAVPDQSYDFDYDQLVGDALSEAVDSVKKPSQQP